MGLLDFRHIRRRFLRLPELNSIEAFNKSRQENPNLTFMDAFKTIGKYNRYEIPGIDLSRENFDGRPFRKANILGGNLSKGSFRGCDFRNAILEVDFSHTDLSGADFSEANLKGAHLQYAIISSAKFYRANLRGASLYEAQKGYGADFTEACLEGADLRDAIFFGLIWDSDTTKIKGMNSSGIKRLPYQLALEIFLKWLGSFPDKYRENLGRMILGHLQKTYGNNGNGNGHKREEMLEEIIIESAKKR